MMKENSRIHYIQTFSLVITNVLCAPGVCEGRVLWSEVRAG